MKLSELSSGSNYVKLLLLGESGAGKSIGASTFPGLKHYADFDNKIESTAMFHAKNKEVLDSISVVQYGKMPVTGDAKTSRKARMQAFLDDLKAVYALQNNKQPLPFQTLVIDTISTMADSILEDYRYVSQLGIKRPNADQNSQSDYGLLATHVKQIITGILSLDCHVVVVGHTMREKDETTGVITNQIMFPGQMSNRLGIYFQEVYFARLDSAGKHVWQTKADPKSPFCKSARGLPPEIPANFAEIVKQR